jgi:chromatin remodeling complex protein RSC6
MSTVPQIATPAAKAPKSRQSKAKSKAPVAEPVEVASSEAPAEQVSVVEEVPAAKPKRVSRPKKEKVVAPSEEKDASETKTEDESEGEKGGKRAKKKRISKQIVDEVDGLLQTLQKDLSGGKLDKHGEKTVRRYAKELTKIHQKAQKIQKKPQVAVPGEVKSSQSGFSKPYQISDELAQFAGWEPGTQKSRVEINNYLCAYIKENGLQATEDKRVIVPNEELKKLLKYEEETHGRLDFAQMQKFISNLVVKQ